MKNTINLISAFLIVLVFTACGGSGENKSGTEDNSPAVKISFEQLASDSSLDNKKVTIDGFVVMPSAFFTRGKKLTIYLAPRANQFENIRKYGLSLSIGTDNNTIEELPKKFTLDDFKIRDDKGQMITQGDYVRITGTFLYGYVAGNSIEATKIEKLPNPGPADYAALSPLLINSTQMLTDSVNDEKIACAEGLPEIPAFTFLSDDVILYLKTDSSTISAHFRIGKNPGQLEKFSKESETGDLKLHDKNGKLIDPTRKIRVYGTISSKSFYVESVEQN